MQRCNRVNDQSVDRLSHNTNDGRSGQRLLAQDFRHPAESLKPTTLKPEKTLQDMHDQMLIMRR